MNDIERLQSHIEISDLLYRYTQFMDAGDFDSVGKLFAEATIITPGTGEISGEQAAKVLCERYTRRYECGTPKTKHIVTNIIIEFPSSGSTANSSAYFQVLQATEKLPLQVICAGRYHDIFFRGADGWKFSQRTIYLDLVGNVAEHLLIPV
jgi:3-phenylpropionate/cinnamic acid dioxygenase small subunit